MVLEHPFFIKLVCLFLPVFSIAVTGRPSAVEGYTVNFLLTGVPFKPQPD